MGSYNHRDIGEEAEWRPPLLYANPLGHRVPATPKRGVVFGPNPPHPQPHPPFKGPKCLRGVRVKECTWVPPMVCRFVQVAGGVNMDGKVLVWLYFHVLWCPGVYVGLLDTLLYTRMPVTYQRYTNNEFPPA